MGIRIASIASVNDFFSKANDILFREITKELAMLGEECVSKARNRTKEESFNDITYNLRSSIESAVYSHANLVVTSSLGAINGGTKGASDAQALIKKIASQYVKSYALVIVAAEDYSDFVEMIEGKDVISSVELYARQAIDERIKIATSRAADKINALNI